MPDDPSILDRAPPSGDLRFAAFDNSYARLPDPFFARVHPTKVAAPRLIKVNRALADELGIDLTGRTDDELSQIFAGNVVPNGADPVAMAYAGHQFGGFSPQLGDGRAILLGEVVDHHGIRRDIQLKGSGPTPFSRRGDGRAALGPVLREYIVSEAFAALGLPTTRSLAAVTTGEQVRRETPLPGAVLTRVASSHVRVGTFQYFASRRDDEAVKTLADYVIDRHCPAARGAERPALALLDAVIDRQAALVAGWMNVGFIHGVMNTDNVSISGETIDFGPCAFLDAYDPAKVFSSIDESGRYAFGNQPRIAQWNLARLAETLLPIIDADQPRALELAQASIQSFATLFEAHYSAGLRAKLGLSTQEPDDKVLAAGLLDLMHEQQADFTLTFRALCAAVVPDGETTFRLRFADPASVDDWLTRWRARLGRQAQSAEVCAAAMRRVNPAYIPRNHRIEQIIAAAVERQDFSGFEDLTDVLRRPFEEQPGKSVWAEPPAPHERVLQTFCGT